MYLDRSNRMDDEPRNSSAAFERQSQSDCALLSQLTLILLFFQVAFTWPLWINSHDYPRISLLGMNFLIRPDLDIFWLIVMGCAGSGLIIENIFRLWGGFRQKNLGEHHSLSSVFHFLWMILCIALLFVMLTNQQRIQAWAWQILLYGICFSTFMPAETMIWIRRLTISIYFYSAVSKLDASFLQSHGQVLLDGTLKLLPFEIALSESLRTAIVCSFPLVELLIAILLCFRLTRRWGWRLSLVLHLGLILILGPFGLNHHVPVLIWNAFFLLQNSLLFAGGNFQSGENGEKNVSRSRSRELLGRIAMAIALMFPATEWFNLCDVWPGWGLYASRGAKVQIYIERDDLKKLPTDVVQHCFRTAANPDHARLDLFRWSFAETNAPAYPEDRFLTAVALAVIQNYGVKDRFVFIYSGTANRWTGDREEVEISDLKTLQRFAEGFWLNTQSVKAEAAENLAD